MRIDGKTGDQTVDRLGAGRTAGEWSMVPRHADAAEDDGWLLSLGYDKDDGPRRAPRAPRPPTPPTARSPGCSSPTASRSASTATGSLTDRDLTAAPGGAPPHDADARLASSGTQQRVT